MSEELYKAASALDCTAEILEGTTHAVHFYDSRKDDLARNIRTVLKFLTADQKDPFVRSFNVLAQKAHENSRSKGFWTLIESFKSHPKWPEIEVIWKLSRIALIHSEASEAVEGIRKDLPDDHLSDRSMEVAELADVVIRILDYAGAYQLPLAEVILEKMAYNRGREFMHGDKKA